MWAERWGWPWWDGWKVGLLQAQLGVTRVAGGTTSCAVACAPTQLRLAMHSPGGREEAPGDAARCQHMLGFRVKCCCGTCFSWEMFSENRRAQETREQAHMARSEQQGTGAEDMVPRDRYCGSGGERWQKKCFTGLQQGGLAKMALSLCVSGRGGSGPAKKS